MSTVIKVENLSKQYRLGQVGTGSLAHDLNRGWHKLRGKEDPYLKIGEANDRSSKGTSEYVWALKNINFEVQQGEVLGIIGRNGAGKSTLLKILSRTTTPTTGSIKMKGRIASLLEVGTGFHPELSGRENIFLNGAIMGMSRQEIKNKFDEIVDFAGVERYIDTPVKRYSSGMYVRLAFGVAAHLEPDILIVDEVLAVGDAEFQKKALGKMKDVSGKDGRTVLFVSHNMAAVQSLCTKGMLLSNGEVTTFGATDSVLSRYKQHSILPMMNEDAFRKILNIDDEHFKIVDFHISNHVGNDDLFGLKIHFSYRVKSPLTGLRIGLDLLDVESELLLFRTFHDDEITGEVPVTLAGDYQTELIIPNNLLNNREYLLRPAIGIHNVRWITRIDLFFST